jgi:carboxypeptidase C (cathepsin A)
MNGGPGAVSIFLALQSLGPVIFEGNDFIRNEKSWCRNSSLLLIDNPAGVGFSYGKRQQDISANDLSNSMDMLKLMIQFYNDFPEYKNNPLYISGISYGGIYSPMLAWQMHSYNLEKNLTGDTSLIFPLKGFIVENAVTDYRSDPNIYTMEMLYAFNLIPQSLYDEYKKNECTIPWTLLWYDLKLIP